MSELRQLWSRINERYQALTRRERLIVALGLILGPVLIGNALFVDPQRARSKALENSLATETASVVQMQAEVDNFKQQLAIDPDATKKAELAALGSQRDKLDEQIRQFGAVLVRPEEMNDLLERLLVRNAGLRLISLKTMPPQSVLTRKEAPSQTEGKPVERAFDLYRHGVEIRIEGNFNQLQAYLAQLETLQQRLLWGQLSYRVVDFPRAEMTLTVYTLSPERTWLAL